MVSSDDTRINHAHARHIHGLLVALLVLCAATAVIIFSGFEPHQLYGGSKTPSAAVPSPR
jgi:hypothetical protein